jgi:hypothetical protein
MVIKSRKLCGLQRYDGYTTFRTVSSTGLEVE